VEKKHLLAQVGNLWIDRLSPQEQASETVKVALLDAQISKSGTERDDNVARGFISQTHFMYQTNTQTWFGASEAKVGNDRALRESIPA
jgi:hypothetical protein